MKKIPLNYFSAVVFAAVPISLAACTGAYVTGEGTEYNIALSEYMNKEVLLNAVRTSKRRPISFAGVGGLQGTINRGAAAAASFPFQDGAKNWTFAPAVKADYNNI